MHALFFLVALFCGSSGAKDDPHVISKGEVLVVAKDHHVWMSTNGGTNFQDVLKGDTDLHNIAVSPEGVYAVRSGRLGYQPAKGARQWHSLPRDATYTERIIAGEGWLLWLGDTGQSQGFSLSYDTRWVAEHEDHEDHSNLIFISYTHGRTWKQIHQKASQEKGAYLSVDESDTVTVGGGDEGGKIWHPKRLLSQPPKGSVSWLDTPPQDRGWILGNCLNSKSKCVYGPHKETINLGKIETGKTDFRVSPAAQWIVAGSLFKRTGHRVELTQSLPKDIKILGVRKNGLTAVDDMGMIRLYNTKVTTLGEIPSDTLSLDIDRRGRVLALGSLSLQRLEKNGEWKTLGL